MKLFSLCLLFLFVFAVHGEEKSVDFQPNPPAKIAPDVAVLLPEGIDAKLQNSSLNWLAKDINRLMIVAVRTKKVLIEKVDDFLYVQIIPNFAYLSEDGEERLGTDLMNILDSGKLYLSSGTEIMQLNWKELKRMKLPFKPTLANRTVFPSQMISLHLDITFFINLNRLTKRLFEMLKSNPLIKPVYNSKQKFYRAEIEGSRLIYMFRIPNIAYEVAYTAEPLQNIIARRIKEVIFLAGVMKQFESRFGMIKGISWDGRYLKNSSDGIIDMWFLYPKSGRDSKKAGKMIEQLLAGAKISVKGSQK